MSKPMTLIKLCGGLMLFVAGPGWSSCCPYRGCCGCPEAREQTSKAEEGAPRCEPESCDCGRPCPAPDAVAKNQE